MSFNEKSPWRTRVVFYSEAVLELGKYKACGAELEVKSIKGSGLEHQFGDVDNVRLLDSRLLQDQVKDITDAHVTNMGIIRDFASRVSLVSYGTAHISGFVSTTKAEVKVGEEFELLMDDTVVNRKLNTLSPKDLQPLEDMPPKDYKHHVVYLVSKSLTAIEPEEKYVWLYTALEKIAENETEEKVKQQCTNCGFEKETFKATSNFITTLLSQTHGMKTKEIKNLREMRGRLAHGTSKRDAEFLSELRECVGRLEPVLIAEVGKRFGITIKNNTNVHVTDFPACIHTLKKTSVSDYKLIGSNARMPALFSKLHDTVRSLSTPKCMVGVPYTPAQPPVFPPIVF